MAGLISADVTSPVARLYVAIFSSQLSESTASTSSPGITNLKLGAASGNSCAQYDAGIEVEGAAMKLLPESWAGTGHGMASAAEMDDECECAAAAVADTRSRPTRERRSVQHMTI